MSGTDDPSSQEPVEGAAPALRPVDGTVRHRPEGDSHHFWVAYGPDGCRLGCARTTYVPTVGSTVRLPVGPDPTVAVRVGASSPGLAITAADLQHRESFDPRRIYETPNGTRVVYKRVERGRVVLWSYKSQAEIMIAGTVELEPTEAVAQPTASSRRKITQKLVAAWLISQNPDITGAQLTAELRRAFPNNKIDTRHGPHYISHSRNGKLPEPPDSDPRDWPEFASQTAFDTDETRF